MKCSLCGRKDCCGGEFELELTAKDEEIARLRAALREIAVQVGVHFDKRYTMNGFLAKDEHGEMCYFNDILNHLEQYTKNALEGK
jgi:hypothetical protein